MEKITGIPAADMSGDNRITVILQEGILRAENSRDYIIPDTVADADGILQICALPAGESRTEDGMLTVEGSLVLELLLSTEGGSISGLRFEEPYSVSEPICAGEGEIFADMGPVGKTVTARLINPRKLNIRYQLEFPYTLYGTKNASPALRGVENTADEISLQRRYETVLSAEPRLLCRKSAAGSQDIELDSSYPQIDRVISCRVDWLPLSCRLHEGDCEVKWNGLLHLLYLSSDGTYIAAEKKFGGEDRIAAENAGEAELSAGIVPVSLTHRVSGNSYGENRILELDYSYDIRVSGIGNREAAAVTDMYSTACACTPETVTLPCAVFRRSLVTGISLCAKQDKEEGSPAETVLTGTVTPENMICRFDGERGKLTVTGDAAVCLILCRSSGEEERQGGFRSLSFSSPIRFDLDGGRELAGCDFTVECTAYDGKFRSDPRGYYADYELSLRVTAREKTDVSCISAVTCDKTSPVFRSSAPMLLYYPDGEEGLWEIAKHYHITKEALMEANALPSEDISGKKVLFIPRQKAPKAVGVNPL